MKRDKSQNTKDPSFRQIMGREKKMKERKEKEKSMIYSKANASSRSFSIKRKRSWHFFDTLRLLWELEKDLGISVFMCTDSKLTETD